MDALSLGDAREAVARNGAVLRALDNSSVTPPDELDRAIKLARASGIPLQYGVTNGGNDGSERERTVIERQVNHLTRLVDDLLDVSRIARGKVELK